MSTCSQGSDGCGEEAQLVSTGGCEWGCLFADRAGDLHVQMGIQEKTRKIALTY